MKTFTFSSLLTESASFSCIFKSKVSINKCGEGINLKLISSKFSVFNLNCLLIVVYLLIVFFIIIKSWY